jgi:hypothetical protein
VGAALAIDECADFSDRSPPIRAAVLLTSGGMNCGDGLDNIAEACRLTAFNPDRGIQLPTTIKSAGHRRVSQQRRTAGPPRGVSIHAGIGDAIFTKRGLSR